MRVFMHFALKSQCPRFFPEKNFKKKFQKNLDANFKFVYLSVQTVKKIVQLLNSLAL